VPSLVRTGSPDLGVTAQFSKPLLYGQGTLAAPGPINDVAEVSVNIFNILQFQPPLVAGTGGKVTGGDANNVSVEIRLDPTLIQHFGNIITPSGFRCVVAGGGFYIRCTAQTFAAGAGDTIRFNVYGINGGCEPLPATLTARVAANSGDRNQVNNLATARIGVFALC
jgi:hypothetical protein